MASEKEAVGDDIIDVGEVGEDELEPATAQQGDELPPGEAETETEERPKMSAEEKLKRERSAKKRALRQKAASDAQTAALLQTVQSLVSEVQTLKGAGFTQATASIQDELKAAQEQRRQALQAGNLDALDQADERIYKARRGLEIANSQQQQRKQPQRPQGDAPNRHAQTWIEDHDWFDPSDETDPDSMVIRAIDKQLAREGLNPRSPEYFEELEERAKERLPHRFKPQRQKPGQVVAGGSRAPSNGAGRTQFPAAYIAAWKARGLDVNDPAIQKRMKARWDETQARKG